jgi:hypothetical protein
MYFKKPIFTYIFSILIILFGVVGTVFSVTGMFYLRKEPLYNLASSNITTSLDENIVSVSELMHQTSEGLENASLTLKQVEESLLNAQNLLKDSSNAFYDIADTVNFEILGYKPLEKSYSYFNNVGDSLWVISEDILKTAQYIDTNSKDLTEIGDNLSDITVNINHSYDSFSETFSSLIGKNTGAILFYILLYISILHVMFIFIGLMFLFKNKVEIKQEN